MDAIFRRSGPSYGSFLGELASVGIAEPCNGVPLATSGLFFLARKDDYLRMIVDPRNANKLCHTPPRTRLPTAAAFSALEVCAGLRLFLSQGDVEVCFYQFVLPCWCRLLFVLPEVQLRRLPVALQALFPGCSANDRMRLQLRVVPMGWSWSVFLIQEALQEITRHTSTAPWLTDKQPLPPLDDAACESSGTKAIQATRLLYVDNYAAFATEQELADSIVTSTHADLAAKGVVSHLDDDREKMLGFQLSSDGVTWRPTAHKLGDSLQLPTGSS